MKQAVKKVDTYKHFLGLALALVMLLVIFSTNIFLQHVESGTQEKLNSAFKVKSTISSLLSSIQDAETGQRGFLLTGKEKYLDPYQQAIITIDDYLSVLVEETKDNPIQQADISDLRLLTNHKLAELKETITLYNQGRQQEAYALVQSDQGKVFMEGIRKITSDMITLEDASLIESQRKLNEVLRFSYLSDFTMIIIFFILLYFSNASYRRTRDIKNNEIQLANLLEATTNGIISVNGDSIIQSANAQAEQIFGYSRDELIGQRLEFLIPQKHHAKHTKDFDRYFQDGKNQSMASGRTVYGVKKSGGKIPLEIGLSKVMLSDGTAQVVATLNDITEKKKIEDKLSETNFALEQEKQNFENFVNLAPVGIAINNLEDGSFKYVNSEFSKFTGYKVDELNKMDYWQLTPKKYEQQEQDQLTSMTDIGRYGPYQKEYIHKEGHHYPVVLSGIRIKSFDGKDYIWSVVQDISDQKRYEEQLKEAKQNAEAATRVKSEFLANMSHEIRTPMNGIMGLNELLLGTQLTNTQREWAEALKTSADSLLTIINDILDLSKIESGKLNIESVPFNLTQLLEQVMSPSAVNANNKLLDFLIEKRGLENNDYIGDPARIKQILLNLVNNAIKFTASGSVTLHVHLNEQLTDKRFRIKFEVKDTGIGINAEQKSKLFDRFSQADSSTTRRFGGTGLGLNISKQLVELMNGEIGCDSIEGSGSTFWFTLELESQAAAHQAIKIRRSTTNYLPERRSKNLKALLVEDNRINQMVAENMFQMIGIQSDTANNGLEAIRLLEKNDYDIVFMDCHMPVMDGFEATKQIRNNSQYKDLPIVALTAGAMESEHLKCISSGMNAVITKPFDVEDIIQALELAKLNRLRAAE